MRLARLWALILAGGEGSRVSRLTTDGRGRTVPKQFWRTRSGATMLDWTLARAQRHARRSRIVAMVSDSHRRWWSHALKSLLDENVLSQPENRGTALALLHAVAHILILEPSARIVVLPSDHFVEDEAVLDETITRAVRTAEAWPEHLVLLGAKPQQDTGDYGWVVPAAIGSADPFDIERFVEKPGEQDLHWLRERGALLNTFMMAFRGWAFIHAFQRAIPGLFDPYMAALDGGRLQASLARIAYPDLPRHDFSRDVLEQIPRSIKLVTLPLCGWTDLGTPERMKTWLDQMGVTSS